MTSNEQLLYSNPFSIESHTRAMMIEQIMALHGRGSKNPKRYRQLLESFEIATLRRALEGDNFVGDSVPNAGDANCEIQAGTGEPQPQEPLLKNAEVPAVVNAPLSQSSLRADDSFPRNRRQLLVTTSVLP